MIVELSAMYRIGIIGCGKIAQVRHIPEYLASGRATLAAFYDLNGERAGELAAKYGALSCASIEELLSCPLDAVSICTANHTHADYAVAALQKGLDVLCEKPMATSLEDCIRMVEAAKKSGRILMIGQNQRLTKTHMKAHELIASGSLGRIISFQTSFAHGGPETWSVDPGKNTWFFDRSKAVMGAMADLGIHKTDLIDYLLDDSVKAVTAVVTTLDKRGADGSLIAVDDNAMCIYEMAGGAVGTMRASWTCYGHEDNSTVIQGTEGVMKLYSDPDYPMVIERKDGSRELYELDAIQTNDNQTSSGVIDCFLDSLDRHSCPISAESVLPAMKAVFAALESSAKGSRVTID